DRAYDSDPLDAELRKDGIEMIAPHRGNRSKPPTQDRRRLSRYMRRWLVERFFAWIQWQRRILIRWEDHAHKFLGFVQLACLVILFKRFCDRFYTERRSSVGSCYGGKIITGQFWTFTTVSAQSGGLQRDGSTVAFGAKRTCAAATAGSRPALMTHSGHPHDRPRQSGA